MSDPHIHSGTIREQLEEREKNSLSPYATLSAESKGRQFEEPDHPYRMPFQRDRERILHTKAFRRLKGKTQVFLAPKGDHYRTRLTHTLEVSQISRTVARALSLNEDLVEAIALGHDLGHTPFGHAGESVLNELYPDGFRHFEQSLRVVDELESTARRRGLNLTHEVRDGILHHSKGKVILLGRDGPMASTLEGRVVSICDAIAYINHDIEDAIRAGVIALADLPKDAIDLLGDTSSKRIGAMATGLISGSHDEVIDLVPDVKEALNSLRDYLYANLYPGEAINKEISKAKRILRGLYEYLTENPRGYIADFPEGDSLERKVVDRLAGMTDQYALQTYQKLFFPESWPA